MLGTPNIDQREVTIIGAGFAGLCAGYHFLQRGYRVTILEKSDRTGGLIQTSQTSHGIVEHAAHSFRSAPNILRLCHDLNVPLATAETKKKFILRNGALRRMPLSLTELLCLVWRAMTVPKHTHDTTMAGWTKTYLGDAALAHLMTPLTTGIYGAAPQFLDQAAAMPALTVPDGQSLLRAMLQRQRSKNKPQATAPLQGMQALTDALQNYIATHAHGTITYNHPCTDLPDAVNIVLATPAFAAAEILQSRYPIIANLLSQITYNPMIAVTIFCPADSTMHDAIGVLYSAHEKRQSLGILFNSATFANRTIDNDTVSYTMLLGGYGYGDILDLSDDALRTLIQNELAAVLKITVSPLDMVITRWPQALPLYNATLRENLVSLTNALTGIKGLMLVGNYTGQISLRGMVDTIFDGEIT